MDIKLDLSEEAISKMVSDAIMKAAIGKALEEAIKKAIDSGNTYSPSPFQKAVDEAVSNSVRMHVHQEGPIKSAIDAACKKAIEELIEKGTVEELATKFASSIRLGSY